MSLTKEIFNELLEAAIQAALEAGEVVKRYSGKEIAVDKKEGGQTLASQVVTEADRLSQETVIKSLKSTIEKYDLGLLAEESDDDLSRLQKEYFWCIDPIDGTLHFIRSKPGYAVSIALISKAGEPVIGVIYDPYDDTLYHAAKGCGVFQNKEKWHLPQLSTTDVDPKKITKGGAVMNACWVLEEGNAYFAKEPKPEKGGGCFWDYAASACLFQECGAWVSDYHGEPIHFNREDNIYLNPYGVLFASNEKVAKQFLKKLKSKVEKREE